MPKFLFALILMCFSAQAQVQLDSSKLVPPIVVPAEQGDVFPPTEAIESQDNRVYRFADEMPAFPGGEEKYKAFIKKNLEIPVSIKNAEGPKSAYVEVVINPDGTLTDAEIIRDAGAGTADAALAVLKKMPKWNPGKVNGQPVSVRMNLQVKFK